jgi:hypothetical protein
MVCLILLNIYQLFTVHQEQRDPDTCVGVLELSSEVHEIIAFKFTYFKLFYVNSVINLIEKFREAFVELIYLYKINNFSFSTCIRQCN